MYICQDCGSLFSQGAWKKGKMLCPECGSTVLTEAAYCKLCHEYYIPLANELWDYTDYCPNCTEAAEEQLREAILQLVDPDYIDLLRSEYGDLDYIMQGGKEQTKSEG
jgi:Zn finger protein HypA/HybF involved in hydrogenase expression